MGTPTFTGCAHLQPVLKRISADQLIADCVRALAKAAPEFDTFAFRGNSGALMAPILAHKLNKELIMVRKPEIDCVSSHLVEGYTHARRYVLVDDLISSGRTAQAIVNGVHELAPQAQLVGLLLYSTTDLFHDPRSDFFHRLIFTVAPDADNRDRREVNSTSSVPH